MDNIKVTKIKPDLLLIEEIAYIEHCNIFVFLKDNEALIFDCGVGLIDLKKYLNNLGITKFRVVPTHSHFDHIAGLANFSVYEIIAPEEVAKNINKKQFAIEFLTRSDFDDADNYDLVIRSVNKIGRIEPNSLTATIDLGKYSFQAINLPGHTNGAYIYFDLKNKILVSGDVIYRGKLFYKEQNRALYLDSLKELAKFEIKLVLPGHNEILKDQKFKEILSSKIKELSVPR